MSEMTEYESMERFREGLKKAADRAGQLAKVQNYQMWNEVRKNLLALLSKGEELFRTKAISRQDALEMLDRRYGKEDG